MKKKILIALTYYLPNISGLSLYAMILAEELAKKGYEIKVVGGKFNSELKRNEEINKVKIERIGGFRLGKGFIMPNYWWNIGCLVRKSEIVIVNLPGVENFWTAGWAKIFGKKLIVIFHCQFQSESKILEKLVALFQSVCLSLADKIVVNSIDYIEGNGLLKNYRRKILEIFPPIKIIPTKEKIKVEGEKVIGYLGRISKEKNLEVLIKAFKWLPFNYKLVLAGPEESVGEIKYKRTIERMIESDKRIIKIGKIDNPVKLFNRIDCLVLPSNNPLESFGMAAVEAIKSGCPVITSDIPGVRLVVILTKMGEIFKSNNSIDLEKKIRLVCKNGKKFYRKRAKNLELFDYKKTVKEYEKIFE